MNFDFEHPVIVDIPEIPFPMNDIYRRLGMPREAVENHSGIANVLDLALDMAKPLIQPKGVVRFLKVVKNTENTVQFATPFLIESCQVAALLKPCSLTVLFMCTIGDALEEKAVEVSSQGDVTLAFILDAIASETADAVADYIHHKYIQGGVETRGYSVTPRFSPGYGDWDVTVQPEIHRFCEGRRIGISVTESCLMIPRKSVSAVFGLKKKYDR